MSSLHVLFIVVFLVPLFIVDASPLFPLNILENIKRDEASMVTWQEYFRSQFKSPTGIIAVLLLIGGDIVQKAIAQTTGGTKRTESLNLRVITPVVFSFGWVSYAFNAVSSALGDGTFLVPPDYPGHVIVLSSGDTRQNQSVLGTWQVD